MSTTQSNNHPKRGSTIKVQPIRDRSAILSIKTMLGAKPRDYCLFVLGINTAYRASELVSIRCGQVNHLKAGDPLDILQGKTKKHRITTINRLAVKAVHAWLAEHPDPQDDAPLFLSRAGGALSVSTVSNMVKGWCADAGLNGNYGSHTLRKTWGFHQLRQNHDLPRHMILPILVEAFGHATQAQTLEYLCIQSDEVARLFMGVEL